MKSVGEVMGIGASFPEALLKAVRMSDPRADLVPPPRRAPAPRSCSGRSRSPDPEILFTVLEALRAGVDPETIARTGWIDRWFVDALAEVEAADAEPALGRRRR